MMSLMPWQRLTARITVKAVPVAEALWAGMAVSVTSGSLNSGNI
jgi:hypothetical protein